MLGDANAPVRESGPRGAPLAYAPRLGAHVLPADEVVLLSERDRFALKGPVHVALAPLLDGTRTADELAELLAGEHAPAHVHLALMRLRGQGLVVEVGEGPPTVPLPPTAPLPSDTPSAIRPLVAHAAPAAGRGPAPPLALGAVRAIGVPDAWAQQLAAAVETGPGARPRGADAAARLTVCLVDDCLRPELAAAGERGEPLLIVRPVGRWLWFGPFLAGPDAAATWALFDQRMRMNRYADVTALERGATLPLFPDDRSPATVATALAIAGRLVAELLGGGAPPSQPGGDAASAAPEGGGPATAATAGATGGMLTYDTVERRFEHHAIAQLAPPRADVAPAFGASLPALALDVEPTRFSGDGGHRTCTPAETLTRLQRFVSPITGIVAGLDPVPGIGGMHVFSAVHSQAGYVTRPIGKALGRKGGAMGKGFQETQARVSCLGEAVERYSGGFFGDEPRRRARWDEVADVALHPEELLLFSDAQYAARANGEPQAADAVPARLDATQAIEWVPARSLGSGATRWLPAAYGWFGYGMSAASGYRGEPYCVADSNGCAAGNTREEAILQGLMELIERDACGIAWYSGARRPQIDLDSFEGQPFAAVREAFAARGKRLHVLDLRVDTDVPVALAVSFDDEDGLATRFALGCHLNPRIAVSRALSELAQLEIEDPVADAALGAELFAAQSIHEQPHLLPADVPAVGASELPDRSLESIAQELEWCVGMLGELDLDVLVLDQTRPEIGFPVVRVTVPGLRHFWRRLAPGRLYDVPAALGWVSAPLREDELNPLSVLI